MGPRIRPALLQRLYESDAAGFQDMDLCDEVGVRLYVRKRFPWASSYMILCVTLTVASLHNVGKRKP